MRHVKQHGNGRCPVILHCLPQNADSMPSVHLATQGASEVRWCARAPRRGPLHTRQWVGTYAGKGKGDYRGELASAVARKPIMLGALRLSWMWPVERFAVPGPPDFRRHYVEVLPLTQTQPEAKPPPRPPRAVRQASELSLAGSARTQRLVGTSTGAHHGGFRTRVSRHQRALGGIGRHRSFSKTRHLPSELIMRAKDLCLPATTSLSCLMLAGNARGNAASSQQTRIP